MGKLGDVFGVLLHIFPVSKVNAHRRVCRAVCDLHDELNALLIKEIQVRIVNLAGKALEVSGTPRRAFKEFLHVAVAFDCRLKRCAGNDGNVEHRIGLAVEFRAVVANKFVNVRMVSAVDNREAAEHEIMLAPVHAFAKASETGITVTVFPSASSSSAIVRTMRAVWPMRE